MKKSIILLAMVLGAFTANAQSVVEGTKLTDNWSVEVNAGAITPLTHSAFFKSMHAPVWKWGFKTIDFYLWFGIAGNGIYQYYFE